jgi:hypothetical protein
LPLTKSSPFKKDSVLNSDSSPYKKTLTHKIKAHEAEEKKNSVTPSKDLQSKLDESLRLNDSLLRHVVDYSFNTCTPAAGQKRKRLTIGLARMKKDPVTSQDTAASREFSALLTVLLTDDLEEQSIYSLKFLLKKKPVITLIVLTLQAKSNKLCDPSESVAVPPRNKKYFYVKSA